DDPVTTTFSIEDRSVVTGCSAFAEHDSCGRDYAPSSAYSPKTNNMVWLRCSRNSGVRSWRRLVMALRPDRIAIYCLPPASNVIGGALKPVPTLIFQTWSRVLSSKAAKVPSV